MPEPIDAVFPILQRIQTEVSELGRKLDALSTKFDALSERMDSFEDYFTFTMGLTQQNTADIKRMRAEIAAIKARLNGPGEQR